jgi:hypothetical protein
MIRFFNGSLRATARPKVNGASLRHGGLVAAANRENNENRKNQPHSLLFFPLCVRHNAQEIKHREWDWSVITTPKRQTTVHLRCEKLRLAGLNTPFA